MFQRLLIVSLCLTLSACAPEPGPLEHGPPQAHSLTQSPARPIPHPDWVATDALGRSLPTPAEAGAPRADRYVGVFYYLWHGKHGDGQIYDITKMLRENPAAPAYGPRHQFHWWGEPEAGYYRGDDPWVLRRNLQLLTNAGVDFLFFDVTNALTYLDHVARLCEVSLQMRADGIQTPEITFATNARSGQTINALYQEFFAPQKCQPLWFYWQGKPLILGQADDPELSAAAKAFFTFRYSWAWTDADAAPHHWQWLDRYPQDYGWDRDPAIAEQIPVAVASHPTSNIGGSYHDGQQPALNELKLTSQTGQGLHFAEQWRRALKVDPRVVMVTQWNEWIAQRFITGQDDRPGFLGQPPQDGASYFVDAFNQEFNRDLEPMRGGHTDNRYYQLVDYVRRFKGLASPVPYSGMRAIAIDGDFTDWQQVVPVFEDPKGDTLHREWPGHNKQQTYRNASGRNDIVESRVSFDQAHIYFYAASATALTPPTGERWMVLFIDRDQSRNTGWEGYDFAINLRVISDRKTAIARWQDGQWHEQGETELRYRGHQLELRVPRSALQLEGDRLSFDFHLADNFGSDGDIAGFFLDGDSAPDRRFNYRFTAEASCDPSPGACDDRDPCTSDSCDEATGCLHHPIAECKNQPGSATPPAGDGAAGTFGEAGATTTADAGTASAGFTPGSDSDRTGAALTGGCTVAGDAGSQGTCVGSRVGMLLLLALVLIVRRWVDGTVRE